MSEGKLLLNFFIAGLLAGLAFVIVKDGVPILQAILIGDYGWLLLVSVLLVVTSCISMAFCMPIYILLKKYDRTTFIEIYAIALAFVGLLSLGSFGNSLVDIVGFFFSATIGTIYIYFRVEKYQR